VRRKEKTKEDIHRRDGSMFKMIGDNRYSHMKTNTKERRMKINFCYKAKQGHLVKKKNTTFKISIYNNLR